MGTEMNKSEIEQTGVLDCNAKEICLGDTVEIFGYKGVVEKAWGAYGIAFDNYIDWRMFEEKIKEITDCDNSPCFCYDDNFISFWEIAQNYNEEEDWLSVVKITEKENKQWV